MLRFPERKQVYGYNFLYTEEFLTSDPESQRGKQDAPTTRAPMIVTVRRDSATALNEDSMNGHFSRDFNALGKAVL